MIKLTSHFKWSFREQPYPLENGFNGEPLYCQMTDLGALPNATSKSVSPNDPIDAGKVYRFWGIARTSPGGGGGDTTTLPYVSNAYSTHWVLFTIPNGNYFILTGVDWSSYFGTGYCIYGK